MNQEIWQQLLSLESRDITQQWYSKIHERELNARRAKEINAAAKQAREYFRNAYNSDYTVRPLLTYYGVASLSRSLLLLLKRDGGEEGLARGHGLMIIDWGKQLSGDLSMGLASLASLRIQTCSGLFSDFIRGTNNRISIHVNSSGVDWRLEYDIPNEGNQVSLGDLLARIPDLFKDYSNVSPEIKYTPVNEMSISRQNGFKAKVRREHFETFKDTYQNMGYNIDSQDEWSTLTCNAETFTQNTPLFVHSYVHKIFGSIPGLHIAEPFSDKLAYSQLGITYLTSYFLGMLARYFPTHWISLIQGDKGDALWPTINRAQQFVENTYPELVIEMINDTLKENESKSNENA